MLNTWEDKQLQLRIKWLTMATHTQPVTQLNQSN